MYFSVFDLASGFNQIRMAPEDQWKTAFSTQEGITNTKECPWALKMAQLPFNDSWINSNKERVRLQRNSGLYG